jgi:endonuclease-8
MEGPSLLLAAEQLQTFCGKEILSVSGTEKIDHALFLHKPVRDIFSWGKHLVLQFDEYKKGFSK